MFPSAWNPEFSEHVPVVRDILGLHEIIESNIEKHILLISKPEHTKGYKEFKNVAAILLTVQYFLRKLAPEALEM